MTQIKTINTGNADLVLVEFPSEISDSIEELLRIWREDSLHKLSQLAYENMLHVEGLFPDLTEEQCRDLVDISNVPGESGIVVGIGTKAKTVLAAYITDHGLDSERTLILKKL